MKPTIWILGLMLTCLVAASCKTANSSAVRSDGKDPNANRLADARLTPEDGNAGLEAEDTAKLIALIGAKIQGKRDAHPKAHGCVENIEIVVDKNIEPKFQNNIFIPGSTYPAIARLSSGSSNPEVNDMLYGPQGFALKILLDGQPTPIVGRLPLPAAPGEEQTFVDVNEGYFKVENGKPIAIDPNDPSNKVALSRYQSLDIIMINGLHEFPVNRLNFGDYTNFFQGTGLAGVVGGTIAATGGQNLGLPDALPDAVKGPLTALIESGPVFQAFKAAPDPKLAAELIAEVSKAVLDVIYLRNRPVEAALLHKLIRYKTWDTLASSYQSWVPYRYNAAGDTGPAVKYQLAAVDCGSRAPIDLDCSSPAASVDSCYISPPDHVAPFLRNPANFLKDVLIDQLSKKDHCFELRAQAWQQGFPSVNFAAEAWGDRTYTKLADVRIPQNTEVMDPAVCESMSFNPGHGLPEMAGTGEMQRGRKFIYAGIETMRNTQVAAGE